MLQTYATGQLKANYFDARQQLPELNLKFVR
ncbi:MAG: hypothetical protein ACJAZ2_002073 [Glaciecola sp.]|jgi:hypothetical protein